MTEHQWSDWITWGGGPGCPVPVGTYVEIEGQRFGIRMRTKARVDIAIHDDPSWTVRRPGDPRGPIITRYRIRKPAGMAALERTLHWKEWTA